MSAACVARAAQLQNVINAELPNVQEAQHCQHFFQQ
jgi:hypothetical protein